MVRAHNLARVILFLCLIGLVVSRGILNDLFSTHKILPGHPFHKGRIKLRLHVDDIRTTVHTEENPAHEDLFGTPRNFSVGDMTPGVHPRIVFDESTWVDILVKYATQRKTLNTWSRAFLHFTEHKGIGNPLLQRWANLDTSAYTGNEGMNKTRLAELASEVDYMSEYHEGGIFMTALHAFVNKVYIIINGSDSSLGDELLEMAINLIVNFSKVLLSHYSTYGCESCPYEPGLYYSDLWNLNHGWGVQNDWLTGGLGIALSYDVLYRKMNDTQRRFVRSAIGLMVMSRQHWGITDFSNKYSPNAMIHPNRIFSNWATYHANLFLTNLAIEGETDFDNMTTSLGVGFNHDIHNKSIALYAAFMKHSIYPEGSSFEDGYMYSLAFREGSLAFIALAKRGHNHIDTPRFRNFIYNGAQMHEPFRCGQFIGHSSGGGSLYPANYGLFLYAYPNSELTKMMWAQRMGMMFNSQKCRIWWHQTMMQLAILGGEHSINYESPSGLPANLREHFALSIFHPRRGIVVARSDLSTDALYFHFDARPDTIFLGHDNADRGVISMTALGRTWLDELPWRQFATSQVHSLMHIDGQAQALKAPSVRMLKVIDDGSTVLSAADLTYAYNVQWARAWSAEWQPFHWEYDFVNGSKVLTQIVYTEKETGNPKDFGWVDGDNTDDLGINSTTKIWGEPNLGFCGTYIWKRAYRQVNVAHAVRSTAVVRNQSTLNYALIGDDFKMDDEANYHNFSSYLILAPGVTFTNLSANCSVVTPCKCTKNPCMIDLMGGPITFLHVHLSTLGDDVDYSFEPIADSGSSRLIISSRYQNFEKFCMVLLPNYGNVTDFSLVRENENKCGIIIGEEYRGFGFNATDHSLYLDNAQFIESTQEIEPEASESSEYSRTESTSVSASSLPTPSASEEPIATLTPSASESYMAASTASNSPSMSSSSRPSESPRESTVPSYYPESSNTAIASASASESVSASASVSSIPSYYPEPSSSLTASPSTLSESASASASSSSVPSYYPEPSSSSSPSPSVSSYSEMYIDPIEPLELPLEHKMFIHEDELEYDKAMFYDESLPGGQIVFDILVGSESRNRTIDTCFRYTKAKTTIRVYDCGPFGRQAYINYFDRACKLVENNLKSRKCRRKNRDQFEIEEKPWAMYFVVISVEQVKNKYIQFALKYHEKD